MRNTVFFLFEIPSVFLGGISLPHLPPLLSIKFVQDFWLYHLLSSSRRALSAYLRGATVLATSQVKVKSPSLD